MSGIKTGIEGTRRLHDTSIFQKHVLSNGIIVWLQKSVISVDFKGYLSVFLNGVGYNADPKHQDGLAHFVEHMMFRGSRQNPSKEKLIEPIFFKGGRIYAFTHDSLTEYCVETSQYNFSDATRVLSEMLSQPLFNQADIPIEREVVFQEIRDNKISGNGLINLHGNKFIFGKNSTLVKRGIGWASSLERISEKSLRDFFEKYYHAGNMEIICGGSFSLVDDVVGMLEKSFGSIPVKLSNPPLVQLMDFEKRGGLKKSFDHRYGVDNLWITYPLACLPVNERFALKILLEYLTNGFGSPLLYELREKRGMVYNANSGLIVRREGMIASVECNMKASDFIKAQDIYFEILKSINSEKLIKYMKKVQEARLNEFRMPVSVCSGMPFEITSYGRPYSYHEWENMEDAVTVDELLYWRNFLISREPLVFHFISKK